MTIYCRASQLLPNDDLIPIFPFFDLHLSISKAFLQPTVVISVVILILDIIIFPFLIAKPTVVTFLNLTGYIFDVTLIVLATKQLKQS